MKAIFPTQIYDGWNTSAPSYVFPSNSVAPVFQSKSEFLTLVFKTCGRSTENYKGSFRAIYTFVNCEYNLIFHKITFPVQVNLLYFLSQTNLMIVLNYFKAIYIGVRIMIYVYLPDSRKYWMRKNMPSTGLYKVSFLK